LLQAEVAVEQGNYDRADVLVDRALRTAVREQLRSAVASAGKWLRSFVAQEPSLSRRYSAFLASAPEVATPNVLPSTRAADSSGAPCVVPLTRRETQVLKRLAEFCSNEEIAADLVLSLNTVKTHMRSLFQKLSVTRRADAVRRGRALGLCYDDLKAVNPRMVYASLTAYGETGPECDREGFDLVEVSFGQVNGLGCVKARTNAYSAPLAPGTKAQIKLTATTVEVWYEGRCVARHARCYGRYQHVLDLEHYLDVLEHKPGAFAGSKPLEQWRRAGRWPNSYDQFWSRLIERHGRQDGTRAMIELLQLGRRLGAARLRSAIESALQLGCADAAAVQHLMATDGLRHQRPSLLLEVGNLLREYERPLPEMHAYDDLLVGAAR
jgi:DNA-binding CsgD family transcriptional regulator